MASTALDDEAWASRGPSADGPCCRYQTTDCTLTLTLALKRRPSIDRSIGQAGIHPFTEPTGSADTPKDAYCVRMLINGVRGVQVKTMLYPGRNFQREFSARLMKSTTQQLCSRAGCRFGPGPPGQTRGLGTAGSDSSWSNY